MEFKIIGKYKSLPVEEIDKAETRKEANYLLQEYRLAFGKDWQLHIKRGNNHDK